MVGRGARGVFGSHPPQGACVRRGGTGRSDWAPRAVSPPGTESCPPVRPPQGGSCRAEGWRGYSPAALGKPPQALPARGVSGAGGHTDQASGWGLHTARLPGLLPTAPKWRLRQPLPAEGWEVVVLSHPGLCHFSETSTPPHHHHHPGPWGKLSTGQAPEDEPSADWAQMRPPQPPTRFEGLCWGCVEVSRDSGLRELSGPPPAAAKPPPQPQPHPGQINIYLEKAKVRKKNLSRNSRPLAAWVA